MAGLLIGLSVMSVLASAALPVYATMAKREKEQELLFRGRQYARAIELYQRKYPNVYPPSIELLIERRFLRKRYQDPMSPDGEFVVIRGGASRMDLTTNAGRNESGVPAVGMIVGNGINGVVSASREPALAVFNGGTHYNEWTFIHVPRSTNPDPAPSRARPSRPPLPSAMHPVAIQGDAGSSMSSMGRPTDARR